MKSEKAAIESVRALINGLFEPKAGKNVSGPGFSQVLEQAQDKLGIKRAEEFLAMDGPSRDETLGSATDGELFELLSGTAHILRKMS